MLTSPDNPINQQIALKTIKKLKFSVSAVWNGQEALEYLMQPNSPTHPRPDIILMDVQMPVMDGYKATHTIRHAHPFVGDAYIQKTPIVAMTASAIQGDREKCENAGMNDYLAKPVKGKILEQMLIKWTLQRRRKSAALQNSLLARINQAESSGLSVPPGQDGPGRVLGPPFESSKPLPSPVIVKDNVSPSPDLLAKKLDKLKFVNNAALERSSETPNSRAMRDFQNEEKAMSLRDEQLIASGDDPKDTLCRGLSDESMHSDISPTELSTSKLTRENVERLADGGNNKADLQRSAPYDEDTSSLAVIMDDTSVRPRSSRPRLGERLRSDGEETVIPEL